MSIGRLITFEGGEGAGKSTQASLLADALDRHVDEVVRTREPGGTPSAEAVRRLLVEGDAGRWQPLTEVLLHYAARSEHVHALIRPALSRGAWIVCDRFADSTLAYQGYGLGVAHDLIADIDRLVLNGLRPDLTFILDLPAETGLGRAARRAGGEERYERMSLTLHQRLRTGFLEIARANPDRCVVIDATADPESVRSEIWDAVVKRLGLAV